VDGRACIPGCWPSARRPSGWCDAATGLTSVPFNSFGFLLGFLPLVLCGCAVFSRLGASWVKSWLIAASVAFYAAGAPAFLPLLIASVAGNFLFLRLMHTSRSAQRWAVIGVALNLAVLGWFKYLTPAAFPPLGLSFFTFTQIGCLLHHADGTQKPPRLRDYALFAAFFPALLAGPILNPRDMLPQFARTGPWRLTTDNLAVGSGFFVIGLLKKALLADPLASVVAAGFADPSHLTLFPAWQAALSYSLMLYFDFSGYSDMAIGLGWMVGLRLPDNFDRPYQAASVIAYWQRWHMSLTRFLMSNVHAPLTLAVMRWRRRHARPIDSAAQQTACGFLTMIALPLGTTMMLVALWHGATLPFLLFGLLHAAFLTINHAWRLARAPALPHLPSVALTYLCVLTGAVLFRAATVTDAVSMLAGMAGQHGADPVWPGTGSATEAGWLLALYAIVWFAPTTRQWLCGQASAFAWAASPRWAVVMGCAAALGLLAAGGTGEFVYFRF
jgi:D-alanyl-lipoteichoic acid acyltransferase DltB (MBOAT superfamily)